MSEEGSSFALYLVYAGLGLALLGGLWLLLDKLGLSLGRLPLDFTLRGEKWEFRFPLATSILLSVVLTVVLNWILRR